MPRTSPRRHRTFLATTSVASVLAVLALGACSASTTGAGSSSDGSSAPSTVSGPGVTADSIKIGFVTLNPKNPGGGGGFTVPDQGNGEKQVDAMVAYANAHGGIAGKKIVPIVRVFTSSTDSPETEGALCSGFTNDDKVFAVVLYGQREPSARTCYKKSNTLMLDVGGNTFPESVFDDLAPYFWSPDTVSFDTDLKALVPSLKTQGFFDGGAKVGVLVEKSPSYEALVKDTLEPAVTAAGSTVSTVAQIDQTSGDTAAATIGNAVAELKGAGVNRLIFVGRADNSGYFTGAANPQKYFPRLAITTFEDPQFLIDNPAFSPPASLTDSAGIGVSPFDDGVAKSYPFPSTDAQKNCLSIYTGAGITFANMVNAKSAMRYCDSITLMQAVGKGIGASGVFNADTFAKAAFALGTTWQGAATLKSQFAPGVYAPASGYQELKYGNSVYTYQGELQTFPVK